MPFMSAPAPLIRSGASKRAKLTVHRSRLIAAALARLQSLQALYAAWPDAERIARKEDCTVNDGKLNYTVTYTVVADICG